MFHPSEADPDGGYRLHPYTIHFRLEEQLVQDYVLAIDYLVIAPRVSYLGAPHLREYIGFGEHWNDGGP